MDNVTHTLTGLMMARAGLARKGERGATLLLLLAVNVPDIDVVLGLPGNLNYLVFHRGYTHALALAPVMAILPVLLAHWIKGAALSWRGYGVSLIGVLSHLAMDLTNV
jgi:inner membrane protein